MKIVLLVLLLSVKSSYTHRHRVFQRDISAPKASPIFECEDKPGRNLRPTVRESLNAEDLIPCGYNKNLSPTEILADIVLVEFTILHIRDFNEKNQDFTMELNIRMFWKDRRFKTIIAPENTTFVAIDPDVADKIWLPDVFIDNIKEVSQPALSSKPLSLRLYNGSNIRYSSTITIKMACDMDFLFYPADTQRCKIQLQSFDHDPVNITWSSGSVEIAKGFTVSSSYDVKVDALIRGSGLQKGSFTSFVIFYLVFKRNLNYHLVQTIFPSIIFVVISWLSFLVPPETVSARMTLCMSTLLTLTTMFSSVRQNTPNESYAKALDVWMLTCMLFVFGTLVEYAVLIKLNAIVVKVKKNDDDDQESNQRPKNTWKRSNLNNFGISKRKESPENDILGIATISHSRSNGDEFVDYEYGDSKPASPEGAKSTEDLYCRSTPSSLEPSMTGGSTIIPIENTPTSINVKNTDPEKFKKIGLTLERISTFFFPFTFLLFNIVFWPTLLSKSCHFASLCFRNEGSVKILKILRMQVFPIFALFLSFLCILVGTSLFHCDSNNPWTQDDDIHNVLRLHPSLIPRTYNWLDPPPTEGGLPLKLEFSVVLVNVRDIDEKKQDITMEMNLRIFWTDSRLKNLTDGADYVVLNPESFEKYLWRPDVFINHAKSVNHTALLTMPTSMRLFSNGSIRYSSRISTTLACQMNFKYYPADTQHCKVDLMSYAYPRSILILGWHQGISAQITSELKLSNFFLSLENTGEFLTTSTSGVYSGIRFTVKLARNMSFHLVQTYLPSSMFVMVTFMTFILPQDSGAVTIAMTALLSITTLFAAVRQDTPNVSYAKAVDIWVAVCMIFEFVALGQHMITMRLRHAKIEPKQKSSTNEPNEAKEPSPAGNEQIDPPVDVDSNVSGITYRGLNGNGNVSQGNDTVAKRYGKEPTCPPPPIPKEDLVSARIKEYKALGNKIRRIFSIVSPASFVLFNIIYWTWLLGSREN
ncbi:unnamed protein product [Allacma fusca]|uniref:Uncharacterized protein n=1 Tax=Allacma fusca TaxID=39272 RepID=A0A8J2KKB6_9HEXA|nr:unnamed protein product [Allacma fusca]